MTQDSRKPAFLNWPPQSILSPGSDFTWTKEVVFDLHNTLVDWTGRFLAYCQRNYGLTINPLDQKFYHLWANPQFGLSYEQFVAAFISFATRARGGYGDLEFYPGAIEQIKEIKDAGIGVKIWTWTPGASEPRIDGSFAGMDTGIAQGVTKELVAKLGVDPDRDLRFISPGEKKYQMFEDHIPLIVEDSPETAMGVASGGHAALLVPTTYNVGVAAPNILRLDHRDHLAPAVIEFFNRLESEGLVL